MPLFAEREEKHRKRYSKDKNNSRSFLMNVHDVLRVQLISKHTQGNGGKLQKPLFPKVFIPSSSPPTGIMWFWFFFFLYSFLISKDLPLYPTIFWSLTWGRSVLSCPAHQTSPLLNCTHLPLSLLSWRRDTVYKHKHFRTFPASMAAACQRLLANSFLNMLKILFMVKANKSHVLGNQSATLTQ